MCKRIRAAHTLFTLILAGVYLWGTRGLSLKLRVIVSCFLRECTKIVKNAENGGPSSNESVLSRISDEIQASSFELLAFFAQAATTVVGVRNKYDRKGIFCNDRLGPNNGERPVHSSTTDHANHSLTYPSLTPSFPKRSNQLCALQNSSTVSLDIITATSHCPSNNSPAAREEKEGLK